MIIMKMLVVLLLFISIFCVETVLTTPPAKVAILGGGPSACTTALALSSQPGWKERYNITIYQLGWRLGGKAASGRNQKIAKRVEEIATHIFPAFYHNFKEVIQSVYAELNRSDSSPMRTYWEAFSLYSYFSKQQLNESEVFKDGGHLCFSLEYLLHRLVTKAQEMLKKYRNIIPVMGDEDPDHLLANPTLLRQKMKTLQGITRLFFTMTAHKSEKTERMSIVDVGAAVVIGILDDKIIELGYDVINHLDLRQWLAKHGANSKSLESGFMKFHYDIMHGYLKGDLNHPDLEAGTALKIYMQGYFCYDNFPILVNQGDVGDVVFAPIYEVLKDRGVNFRFFHKVKDLTLDKNNPRLVDQIRITKQVNVINSEYDPLIDVKGLPSWPSSPKYEEIVKEQADLMQENNIDLESFWTRWSNVYEERFNEPLPEVTLKIGQDFDIVVYGMPVATLPHLCPELLQMSPALKAAYTFVGRTTSIQLQLWINEDWSKIKEGPYNMYTALNRQNDEFMFADCNYLKLEDWDSLDVNTSGSQFVTFMTNIEECPPRNNTQFVFEQQAKADKLVISKIENAESFRTFWPGAFNEGQFDWNILTDPENRVGKGRFDAQYLRVNINPSDRLTQFHSGTSKYRITTDGAGFDNIYFTGDWIQNGYNCCTEGAITAGLLTAKAISGFPREIFWEQFIN